MAIPRPDLLAVAADRLAAREGVPAGVVRWRTGEPLARPHSTLVPMVAELGGGRTAAAWHKVIYVPCPGGEPDAEWARQEREGIDRGRRADEELNRRYGGAPPPLRIPTLLAADPASLTVVMSDIAGQPLGRLVPRRLPPWRGWRRRFVRLGAALRILDSIFAAEPPSLAETAAERRLRGALDRARPVIPARLVAPIERRLAGLWDGLASSPVPATFAHGDLSGSNAFLGADGSVGLIDLAWRPRLSGFDLATYSVRLELEAPRVRRLARAAIAALAEGYGAGALTAPGFLIERSQRMLRLLGEGVLDGVPRHRAAFLRELSGRDPGPQEDARRLASR